MSLAAQLDGVDFLLVGGLAVQLLGEGTSWNDDLSAASRPTYDIDIAVRRIADLKNLAKVKGTRVDVLELEVSRTDLGVEEGRTAIHARLPDDSRSIHVPGTSRVIRVVGPASLVVMKAAAIADPARGKRGTDLADIATLALREREKSLGLREQIASWKPEMRKELIAAVGAVKAAFASPESEGSYEFSKVLRGGPIFDYDEWLQKEIEATERASIAVRLLLEDFA